MLDYATALADGIEAALPRWVEGCVARIMTASTGSAPSAEVAAAAAAAGVRAEEEVGARVRALLAADIDEQMTTPLALLRAHAVGYPTEVLRQAGITAVVRDAFSSAAFPDDIYDLSPSSWADLSPDLVDPGIAWGAAKAFEHKRRHRS